MWDIQMIRLSIFQRRDLMSQETNTDLSLHSPEHILCLYFFDFINVSYVNNIRVYKLRWSLFWRVSFKFGTHVSFFNSLDEFVNRPKESINTRNLPPYFMGFQPNIMDFENQKCNILLSLAALYLILFHINSWRNTRMCPNKIQHVALWRVHVGICIFI